MYYDEDENVWVQPTGYHVETAAKQLLDALRDSYVDVNGQPRPVKGDITKLQYVRGLKPMARKLLANTPNCPSRGEIPKILKLAWGKAFVEVVAMRRLACV